MQAISESIAPKKFAVSYLRVSSKGQAERGGGDDEGYSIPAQREANKRKAHSMGAIIGKEFVDRGKSARSAKRPELQKMLDYVRENKERIDYVIIHKVDRWARNRGDDADITRAINEAGVQLVSASENIDSTPSGQLVHGIMSTIAEFYSSNLSAEVKKGKDQKVKNGGTPSKAPLGYRNIRDFDEMGRRNSRVELDPERAPMIKLAFEEYATNNWSLSTLAEHLADIGLATPKTPNLPAKPINKKILHDVLTNPYYKGIILYNNVEYAGKHEKIVNEYLWEEVQAVLRSNVCGERTRIHEHYLKSTVYCGKCGARLIIHNAKSRCGNRYPYFVCSARHSKRNNCDQRSLLIDEIEDQIVKMYGRINFTSEFRNLLEQWIISQIDKLADESKAELERLKKQKDKLEREQRKLLQAHYADAVPLDLLKEEQARIGDSLRNITGAMEAHQSEHSEITENIHQVFELLDDCGRTYEMANGTQRRCFNQALFEKIRVCDDMNMDADYTEPFATLLNPAVFELKRKFTRIRANQKELPETVAPLDFCLTDPTNFFSEGLSKSTYMRLTGIEPARSPTRS